MGNIHKRVAKALGIERPRRSARVRLADGRRFRLGVDTAIVLEALGLVVDSRRGRLVPSRPYAVRLGGYR
jgi:hypothetical protein